MKNILVRESDHKVYINLHRPSHKNALNQDLIINLTKILKKINQHKNIHAVCLTGSRGFFCAGADLAEMKKSITLTQQQRLKNIKYLSDLFELLYTLKKPTVAVVQGGAYGGGLGLIACCDIAIAEQNAKFCFSESKLGLVPALISPYIINLIGANHAKRFFLTAEVFDAHKARQIGLLQETAENQEKLDSITENMLDLLCQNSPTAMTKIKTLFDPVKKTTQHKLIKLLAAAQSSKDAQQRLADFFKNK